MVYPSVTPALPAVSADLKHYGFSVKSFDCNIKAINGILEALWDEFWELLKGIYNPYESVESRKTRLNPFGSKDYDEYEDFLKDLPSFNREQLSTFYRALHWYVYEPTSRGQYVWKTVFSDLKRDIVSQSNSRIVGISVNTTLQYKYAMEIAKDLRQYHPSITIIMGGSFFTFERNGGKGCEYQEDKVLQCANYIVKHESELSLSALCNCILNGLGDVSVIPNLVYLKNGKIVKTKIKTEINPSTWLPLDFSDVDFSLYLTPRPVVPIYAYRQCYWGSCTFCDVSVDSTREKCFGKNVETIIREIADIIDKYNVYDFYFTDPTFSPEYLRDFVEALSKEDFSDKIKWHTMLRHSDLLTKDLIQKASSVGLINVRLGTETFNSRLLKILNKGVTRETVIKNIKDFADCGVNVFCFLITGIPTETPEEIIEDKETALSLAKEGYIHAISLGKMRIIEGSYMNNNRELFGITSVNPDDPSDITLNNCLGYPIDCKRREIEMQNYITAVRAVAPVIDQLEFTFHTRR